MFFSEIRFYLLQAGLSLYIYKDKRLGGMAVEDVVVRALVLRQFVKPVLGGFLVQLSLCRVILQQGLYAILFFCGRGFYLQAVELAQIVVLQPAWPHHHLRDILLHSQLIEGFLDGQPLLCLYAQAGTQQNQ